MIKELTTPSGIKVKLQEPTVGDLEKALDSNEEEGDTKKKGFEKTMNSLVPLIKGWDFKDGGKPVEVSHDGFRKLTARDGMYLINAFTAMIQLEDKKK